MTLTTVSTAVLHCDKTFKVCFVLIFAVFLPDFIFCTTVAQSHPSFIVVGPLVAELWHFQCFPTWRPAANLI